MFDIIKNENLNENEKCTAIKAYLLENPLAIIHFTDLKNCELGLTPLHLAVINNLPAVAILLLDVGFPVDTLSARNLTPLHMAVENGLDELVLLLGYHHCNFDLVDNLQDSALHKAIFYNHPKCVENLLLASKFKINKNLRNSDGYTPKEIIQNIKNIKSQSDLDEAYNIQPKLFDRTPLHLAVINNSQDLIQSLLKLGAPINEPDLEGKTALHFAAQCGHAHILLYLCYREDINMDAVDNEGNTALHKSVEAGHRNCVKTLMSAIKPANKNIKNKQNLIAAELIQTTNYDEILALEKALFTTQVTNGFNHQFEQDMFSLYKINPNNNINYLKEQFKGLELSISTKEFSRRASEGSSNSLIKRTQSSLRKKPSYFSSDPNEPITIKERAVVQFAKQPVTPVNYNAMKNILENAYVKNDNNTIINIIQTTQANNVLLTLLPYFQELIEKHQQENIDYFITLLYELKPMLATTQKDLAQQCTQAQSIIHKKLLADGLKKNCPIENINQLTQEQFLSETDSEETQKNLKLLINLCSGIKDKTHVIIDLNTVMLGSLGLMDFIEPHEIISSLISLNPLFSPTQQLLSHFIVLTLIELCDSAKNQLEENLFASQIQLYINTCCDLVLARYLKEYSGLIHSFKTNPLYVFIEQINSLTFRENKETKASISDKLTEFANRTNLKSSKLSPGDVHYFAKEFNMINAKFYQSCMPEEFRLTCWDKKASSQLSEHVELIDTMTHFIKHSILSYATPAQQAQLVTLFILIARESLHYQYGADMNTVMAITLALMQLPEECFSLLDKNTLTIKNGLFNLVNPSSNFKCFRELQMNDQRTLPFIGVIFGDKSHSYELDLHDNVRILGKIYQSLIVIKRELRGVFLDSQSDLLDVLQEFKNNPPSDNEIKIQPEKRTSGKSLKIKEGLSPKIELSLQKEPSPRKESPRKEGKPHKDSLRREPSPRKELSPQRRPETGSIPNNFSLFSPQSASLNHEKGTSMDSGILSESSHSQTQ